MKASNVALIAIVAGFTVGLIGLAAYQAWWTVAFPIGAVVVAIATDRHVGSATSIAAGGAICGAVLLAVMSLFLLYGGVRGPARPCDGCDSSQGLWLAASFGSIVSAIVLVLLARWLLRHGRNA